MPVELTANGLIRPQAKQWPSTSASSAQRRQLTPGQEGVAAEAEPTAAAGNHPLWWPGTLPLWPMPSLGPADLAELFKTWHIVRPFALTAHQRRI
jgi:hypothetical protein